MPLSAGFFQKICCCCLAGKEKNLAARQDLANADRGFNTVHVRHNDIADDQIWPGFTRPIHGRSSSVDGRGVKAVLIENYRQRISDHALVVHYQDSGFGRLAIGCQFGNSCNSKIRAAYIAPRIDYNVSQRAPAQVTEMLDLPKKVGWRKPTPSFLAASHPLVVSHGGEMMRRAATLVLIALVATATVFAQVPAGTSNTQPTTPQAQSPALPNHGAAPTPATSSADTPHGASQPSQTATPLTGSPARSSSTTTNQATTPENAQGAQNSMQNASAPNSATVVDQVGAGTELRAALDTPLSTRTSKPGDRFTATISDPLRANNDAVVIPAGARVEGEVAEADEGKTLAALRGKGKLNLRFRDVVLPTGQTLPLTATLISVHDTGGKSTKKADEEGQVESGTRGKDAAKDVGIGSGPGTPAGLIFGGPIKGLAIGALAGGGYVLATKGKDVNLPAQTGMVIRLDQPLSWSGSAPLQR
jgi:hypothetical protein